MSDNTAPGHNIPIATRLQRLESEISTLKVFLPAGEISSDDRWNLAIWLRTGTASKYSIDFSKIHHSELKLIAKRLVLQSRKDSQCHPATCVQIAKAATALSNAVGRDFDLSGVTDYEIAAATTHLFQLSPSGHYITGLNKLIAEIEEHFNIALAAVEVERKVPDHGARGHDAGRRKRDISDFVVSQLVSLANRSDLAPMDRLLLNGLSLNTAAGCRASELLSLHHKCVEAEGEGVIISLIDAKTLKAVSRPVHHQIQDVVRKAYETICQLTASGREVAREIHDTPVLNWQAIAQDSDALLYFIQKELHAWAKDPCNNAPYAGAFFASKVGWIDPVKAVEESHGSIRCAAELLGVNYGVIHRLLEVIEKSQSGNNLQGPILAGRDPRVLLVTHLERIIGHKVPRTQELLKLFNLAGNLAISGAVILPPAFNAIHEDRYVLPPVSARRTKSGKVVVHAHDALFVVKRDDFLGSRLAREQAFYVITKDYFQRWLCGSKLSPSICERYDVRDEDGNIAKITSHQFRHWLSTRYHRGGLTDAQIALIFNRVTEASVGTYNQTLLSERRERVRNRARTGEVIGRIPSAVAILSKYSSAEATDLLHSMTQQINVMPHGLCTKDLVSEPCPHYMSCLSCSNEGSSGSTACTFLMVDTEDEAQIAGLREVKANAIAMLTFLEQSERFSQQRSHFQSIVASARLLLGEVDE